MTLDEGPEAPDRQLVAVHLGFGRDGRAPGRLVDQGHLPEGIAWTELPDLLAVHLHGRLAAFDHHERSAGLTFLGDVLARRVRPLDEFAAEPVEELLVRLLEEGDPADQLDARAGHARILTCARRAARSGRRSVPARRC